MLPLAVLRDDGAGRFVVTACEGEEGATSVGTLLSGLAGVARTLRLLGEGNHARGQLDQGRSVWGGALAVLGSDGAAGSVLATCEGGERAATIGTLLSRLADPILTKGALRWR